MPGRKQEADQSRRRLRHRITKTIDSPVFRYHVRDLREVLRIDKAKRDFWVSKVVEHKKGLAFEKPKELPSGWRPFESEPLQVALASSWHGVKGVMVCVNDDGYVHRR